MVTKIGGLGRKRPQINASLNNLLLDNQNPRLPEEYKGSNQSSIFKILYTKFDLEEIAFSMAENGYFDEEPLVVTPQSIPKEVNWDWEINDLQDALQDLNDKNKIKFIVVEGNRRVATATILTDLKLRAFLRVKEDDWPTPSRDVAKDLLIIPSIVYKNRDDISPYLGVRHIAGILKWEAYAKAKYIASRIDYYHKRGFSINAAIGEVQKKVGDRSDSIKIQYMCFNLLEQAREDIDFDIDEVTDRFSLITLALRSRPIREFIGVPSHKEATAYKSLVPSKKLKNFELLFTWIFGKGQEIQPIITDSRKIGSRLAHIVGDKEATEYLIKYGNIEEAYERSGGERDYLLRKINGTKRSVEVILGLIHRFKKDKEIFGSVEVLLDSIRELKKRLNSND
jgi:hypothetical protein